MKTLLIIDLQNDFLEGGALPVPGSRALIPQINELQLQFDLTVASRDWHPQNHCSFAENHPGKKPGDTIEFAGRSQILWPTHCVQNTVGADFPPELNRKHWKEIFSKGTDPYIDSYSAFFDNAHQRSTGLTEYLKDQKITEIYVVGIATDYCVKFSVLDALKVGFQPIVIKEATRGIDLQPHDVEKALAEMKQAGARII